MRPSDITDGIFNPRPRRRTEHSGFNEAVGYYRRNHRDGAVISSRRRCCFNEAVGYYRRNREEEAVAVRDRTVASMRPSDITDGIVRVGLEPLPRRDASMRPSDITDGIPAGRASAHLARSSLQ